MAKRKPKLSTHTCPYCSQEFHEDADGVAVPIVRPPVQPSNAPPVQEPPLPYSVERAIESHTVEDSAKRDRVTADARDRLDVGETESDVIEHVEENPFVRPVDPRDGPLSDRIQRAIRQRSAPPATKVSRKAWTDAACVLWEAGQSEDAIIKRILHGAPPE